MQTGNSQFGSSASGFFVLIGSGPNAPEQGTNMFARNFLLQMYFSL